MINTVRAKINGTWHTLTYNNSTGKYEATISAPSKSSYPLTGHYYPVTIEAIDSANNTTTIDTSDTTFGTNLRLVVKEKVPPVITVTSPTDGSVLTNNTPAITWTVTDNDSGINATSITVSIDGILVSSSSINKSAIANGYSCSISLSSGLSDGTHTFVFNASDNDGNAAITVTSTVSIDTVPPMLTITSPENDYATNADAVVISGVTNDETSSPVTVVIKIDDVEITQTVTVDVNGNFSVSVPIEDEGSHTIKIIATDAAGKNTEVTRTVLIDRTAPTITAVSLTPNPVDVGATYIVSVTVVES